ncbi:hypothetical protein PO902_15455 [Planococcus maritimus]|nr:hypothetical protein [Planococcus sp. SK3692]MDE4086445.1 hypothetical protein [Planococcus maritimus]
MERCSCGQPYKTEAITYFPDKDTFKKNCPNCGRTLQVKAHAIDVEWTFDQNWKKE